MAQPQLTSRLGPCGQYQNNKVRHYRLLAQLTQRSLAGLICVQRSSISAWERGRRLPTTRNLLRLAHALDTLAEAFYFDLYRPKRSE